MRTAILLLLAAPSLARADDGSCRDDEANRESCSALWPTNNGRSPGTVTSGFVTDDFDPAGHSFEEKRIGYASTTGQFSGDHLSPMHGNGFYIDVRLHPNPTFYVGVDLRAAWGDAPTAPFAFAGGTPMSWDSAWLMTMAGVAGARIPLGRISLRAEVVAGLHGATLSSHAMDTSASTVAPLVEPRIAADLWLSPWWAVEAMAGANALDRSEHVFGVGLALHLQAFDGRFR
ncbi:MAG: hypothetical protein JO257_37055 [Deltaproteobacteria bacterium]|nr:hypothetical protein [Deltaproteobacteria bacterium]